MMIQNAVGSMTSCYLISQLSNINTQPLHEDGEACKCLHRKYIETSSFATFAITLDVKTIVEGAMMLIVREKRG